MGLEQGTEVRVDIPDATGPDFERYHRRCGTIVATVEDCVGKLNGDDYDNVPCRVGCEKKQRPNRFCETCEDRLDLTRMCPFRSYIKSYIVFLLYFNNAGEARSITSHDDLY